MGEHPYGDTTAAIEDSVVCYISKEDFDMILAQSKFFSRLLLKSLSHEFSVLANLMAVFSQRTVREQIALSLLILQDKYKENPNSETLISLSRSDLANMAGTVLETLARVPHDFKSEGVIKHWAWAPIELATFFQCIKTEKMSFFLSWHDVGFLFIALTLVYMSNN